MALERIGLGAILDMNSSRFVRGTKQARDELGRFVATGQRMKNVTAGISSGFNKIGGGLRNLGFGLAPMGLAIGGAAMKAATFEKQLDAVGAVSRANSEDMARLGKKAKEMGASTVFTATQAGEAMEYMARAGAKPTQIIEGLAGVVNAAAADSMELGSAADIVAQVVKGMGMEWGKAGHIADVLALASASANTNISGLGESFRYGVGQARAIGISLEQTTAIFSRLADAGLKGSLAGTAFTNMINKLSKPTAKAKTIMKKWNISLVNADGSMRKIYDITQDFTNQMEKIPNRAKRAQIASEVFGIRGARAFNALAAAGADSVRELEQQLDKASEGEGAAAIMAKRRLDNFLGSIVLLKSALEGLSIELFGPLMSTFKDTTTDITGGIQNVVRSMQDLNSAFSDGVITRDEQLAIEKQYGKTAVQIALGLRDTIDSVKNAWGRVSGAIKSAATWLNESLGGEGVRKLTKIATILAIVAGAVAPLLLSLFMVKLVVGGLISIFSGLVGVITPILIPIGIALLMLQGLRKENESLLDTAIRVFGEIKTWVMDVWQNALKPLITGIAEGFLPIIGVLGQVWADIFGEIKNVVVEFFGIFFDSTDYMETNWREIGQVIGAVLATIVETVAKVAGVIIKTIVFAIRLVLQTARNVGEAFGALFSGDILGGLKRLGLALLDYILLPIRTIINAVTELAKAMGAEDLIPKSVQKFAEKGFTGLMLPKTPIGGRLKRVPPAVRPEGAGKRPETMTAASAAALAAEMAAKGKAAGAAPTIKTQVDLTDKRTLDIKNSMCVNGEDLTVATGRHKQELSDRAGFKSTPWQRRVILEHGAIPAKG